MIGTFFLAFVVAVKVPRDMAEQRRLPWWR